MKKIATILTIGLLTIASVSAKDFVPAYDSETNYISNFADWGEYEAFCWETGKEPSYVEFKEMNSHCDFEKMNELGINEAEELEKLMKNIL